jgi:hypothetical protein
LLSVTRNGQNGRPNIDQESRRLPTFRFGRGLLPGPVDLDHVRGGECRLESGDLKHVGPDRDRRAYFVLAPGARLRNGKGAGGLGERDAQHTVAIGDNKAASPSPGKTWAVTACPAILSPRFSGAIAGSSKDIRPGMVSMASCRSATLDLPMALMTAGRLPGCG